MTPEESLTCGREGAETLNWSGRRMLRSITDMNFFIVNTCEGMDCGKTYFTKRKGKSQSTRVGYIIIADTSKTMVNSLQTEVELGWAIQGNNGFELKRSYPYHYAFSIQCQDAQNNH